MRHACLIAATLVVTAWQPLTAQIGTTSPQAEAAANRPVTPVNPAPIAVTGESAANHPTGSVTIPATNSVTKPRRMQFIHAELMGKLDSKSARVGDLVILRMQETVRMADGVQILKGARIMGHVTAVIAHGKDTENAAVAVAFDHAEMKGVAPMPIYAQIQWAEPLPNPSTAEMLRSQQNMGGGVMGNAVSVMSGMENGGIGAGGNNGMIVTGGFIMAKSPMSIGMSSASTYGVQAPVQKPGDSVATAHTVTSAGGKAPATIRATGVPGVMLAGDPSGQNSGTFMAAKQNVHLEGATRMVLAVAMLN